MKAINKKLGGATPQTIKQIIEKKLTAWLKTIPEDLCKNVQDHLIITGGCIPSMLLNEPINDFDIYCDDKQTAKELASYYVKLFIENHPKSKIIPQVNLKDDRIRIYIKSAGIIRAASSEEYRYFEQDPADSLGAEEYVKELLKEKKDPIKEGAYLPVYLSENAISLSDQIQIIIRFIGSPEEIHKNYDYVHVTSYYYTKDKQLVLASKALISLLSKTLYYQGSLYPICSLFRMRKFLKRGWNISAGEITKIAIQISLLDLSDIDVLREQLIGVDVAYFRELITMIEEYKKGTEEKPIEASYVIQLINKISDF